MKHVNYTCDFCGFVMAEETERHNVKVVCEHFNAIWNDVPKEWEHVCSPCYLHMESKFKSMKSVGNKLRIQNGDNVNLSEEFRDESSKVMLELALELAEFVIKDYQKYCDTSEIECKELGIDRREYLKNARHYGKYFEEAIEEIKAKKK